MIVFRVRDLFCKIVYINSRLYSLIFMDIRKERSISRDELFYKYTGDIQNNSDFIGLKAISNHGHIDLYQHSIQVSRRSMNLCRTFGLDDRAAARGGLLHDFYLYEWRKGEGPGWHGFRHGKIALFESLKRFHLTDKEQNIILRHMWPLTLIPPSSLEGLIVSIMDKICALEEIIFIDDLDISSSGEGLWVPDVPANKRRSGSMIKRPFIIKTRIIVSRFQALITG